jgi:hypothetical protein
VLKLIDDTPECQQIVVGGRFGTLLVMVSSHSYGGARKEQAMATASASRLLFRTLVVVVALSVVWWQAFREMRR